MTHSARDRIADPERKSRQVPDGVSSAGPDIDHPREVNYAIFGRVEDNITCLDGLRHGGIRARVNIQNSPHVRERSEIREGAEMLYIHIRALAQGATTGFVQRSFGNHASKELAGATG
jgi:hypothetical protein